MLKMLKYLKLKFSVLCLIMLIFFQFSCTPKNIPENPVSLKEECLETLFILTNSLLDLQITDQNDPDFGAIQCPSCNVLHTRAAEAVFPFAIAYKNSQDEKYLHAAKHVTNWLIKQQQSGGEWIETPWDWTGTTADQLLMMVSAFPILKDHLLADEKVSCQNSIRQAADYLERVMSPDFASINYCPTTAAVLAKTYQLIPDERYLKKARQLARWTVAKMDEDGFIDGEAARVLGVKYGVDLGYQVDMSLWGLELYARETADSLVHDYVKKSLENCLYFVYPDGGIDGSWGARCYKWTTYGSKTADGCQILFSLFANEDARYRTAAIRNLHYLRTMMQDGMIGYGPHYFRLFDKPPCNYPTFARAKNLAMAIEFAPDEGKATPPLPSDQVGWVKFFPTVDVAVARSENFMTTISAYGYKDKGNLGDGKYIHRPSGGSITNLWVKDHGLLQTSSQTQYVRGEPMHMPVLENIICLTPRIEFTNEQGYFTNLYECDGRISVASDDDAVATISTSGALSNEHYLQGGVSYIWTHKIFDDAIEKMVQLRYHDRYPEISIVETIVHEPDMIFEQVDNKTVLIKGGKREFRFEILQGDVEIEMGKDEANFWYPFPSLKCYPIVLKVIKGEEEFIQKIIYRISLQ